MITRNLTWALKITHVVQFHIRFEETSRCLQLHMLDRLWWLWQQKDTQNRLYQYRGAAAFKSLERASVKDLLLMGELITDIEFKDVLDTESGLLCYNY
ncbi:hypothetical protein BHYA_0121g00150 [Botrytis hyacinthi]|uniref:Uncharacterized protein n=1 Tax=Botrytis hyacinthi TaxID=278943 RepID=A0A4Z1GI07_9HELO|nr:hypothetical protein BHYA_0121g00150 [Botrytis hyacinthi]